jgi:hypothetical protein
VKGGGGVFSASGTGVLPSSNGHPPHSSASTGEVRLRVGPRALSGKKKLPSDTQFKQYTV